MVRSLVLCLFVLLAACRGSDETASLSPVSTAAPVAPPPAEPEVDMTFASPEAVEAWRAGIATQIQTDAAVPHPREIWRYAADFRVDRNRPDPFLGDPAIWDAAGVVQAPGDYGLGSDVPTPTPDQALAFEAQDEEWAAAELWIMLGRLDDAKRCSVELEKESEWKAVAMIAVHTGDLESLDRATKKMVDADQTSRTRVVIAYAFEQGKVDVAKHIAKSHGWSLAEVLDSNQVRELALKGDSSLLIDLLNKEIVAWEKNDFSGLSDYLAPQIVVADIALLAKIDKVRALEYARHYLTLPHANVLIWIECGEACYSDPVRGSLELYQLVHQDKELRELYLARTRQAVDAMYPINNLDGTALETEATIAGIQPDEYPGLSSGMWDSVTEGNLLTSYLLRVRQIRDPELTTFWVAMLDTFPSRSVMNGSLDFDRELGRCALGLPFYQSVGNITPTEKFILEDLQDGANTQMEDAWAALPDRERIEEVIYLFSLLTRGKVTSSREAAIRAELGIEQTPGQEESLRSELGDQFRRSLSAHYGEARALRQEFDKAQSALQTNEAAQSLRRQRGLPSIELYPDTDAEYDELMAPSLELLCASLTAKCALWPRLTTPVVTEGLEATEPTVEEPTAPAPAPVTPTNCTFVNGSRPKVGEKYVVRCDDTTYLATADYKGGGVYDFTDLTPHTH